AFIRGRAAVNRSRGGGGPCSQHLRNRRGYRQTWTRARQRPDRSAGRVHRSPSPILHQAGAAAPIAGRLRLSDVCRGRRLDVVWTRCLRLIPALSFLYRSHLEGSQAGRSSRSAADEVRAGHQSQDRQGAWPPNSRQAARHRRRGDRMKRREFITLLGGAAAAWPLAARAQQSAMPVIGFINSGYADASAPFVTAFRKGLNETGFVDGQNVRVEYHWLEGKYDQLPALMVDLVRRGVSVIATPVATVAALAAKAATATVPIVFGVGGDPVQLGLVASLARPGGNATGINFFNLEVTAKRLRLLHELVPKAVRIAVLVNPANTPSTEFTLRAVQEAAPAIGLQTQVLNATTIAEIDAVFAGFAREHPDALFLAGDAFFLDRRVQFATLTARDRIPAIGNESPFVKAGGLMSYGTDLAETFRQVGNYTGRVLKGEKPADLPVQQPTKFELVINLTTARAIGIIVPDKLLALADEVIE